MKYLFDPIYTADVSKCASAVKFKRLADGLLKNIDCYIHWFIPSNIDAASQEWLPKDDRITYQKYDVIADRYAEYKRLPVEVALEIDCKGSRWDWDILVTNRTSQVPTMYGLSSTKDTKHGCEKPIIVIEDFPLMDFKGSSAVARTRSQNMYTVNGYMLAAKVLICAYWEREIILDTAKDFVSFSGIRDLREKLVECHPFELKSMLNLKEDDIVSKQQTSDFNIVFAGRMVNGHNFDKIFNIMGINLVLKSNKKRKVNGIVCTQSKTTGQVDVPEFVDVRHYQRDDFWNFMKTEASVGIFYSDEEDYSMSLIEPLLLGVPYAVFDAPWSRASLGDDYPFFFKSEMEAYTIVKGFHDNYAKMYEHFAKWHSNSFSVLINERDNITILTEVLKVSLDHYKSLKSSYITVASEGGKTTVEKLFDLIDGEEKSIPELIKLLGNVEEVRSLYDKLKAQTQFERRFAFLTDLYHWKRQFLTLGAEMGSWGKFYKKPTTDEKE